MNQFDEYQEKANAMRSIGNYEAADDYEQKAEDISNLAFDGLVATLGFGVKNAKGVRLLVDDMGNEREATLTERVLWDALISAQSEFAHV